jgi:hypothetical protein
MKRYGTEVFGQSKIGNSSATKAGVSGLDKLKTASGIEKHKTSTGLDVIKEDNKSSLLSFKNKKTIAKQPFSYSNLNAVNEERPHFNNQSATMGPKDMEVLISQS